MILKLIKLLCFLGIHNYKTINIEWGFNPTDRVTTLECKIVVLLKLNLVDRIYTNEKYSKKYRNKKIFRVVKNSKGQTNSYKIV